jgi:hypothetical protein
MPSRLRTALKYAAGVVLRRRFVLWLPLPAFRVIITSRGEHSSCLVFIVPKAALRRTMLVMTWNGAGLLYCKSASGAARQDRNRYGRNGCHSL